MNKNQTEIHFSTQPLHLKRKEDSIFHGMWMHLFTSDSHQYYYIIKSFEIIYDARNVVLCRECLERNICSVTDTKRTVKGNVERNNYKKGPQVIQHIIFCIKTILKKTFSTNIKYLKLADKI